MKTDHAGKFADYQLGQLKRSIPELQWEALKDILEPAVISDLVMSKAKDETEDFNQIVARVGKMVLCTQLILENEDAILGYYRERA